jgi:hypothetical protein
MVFKGWPGASAVLLQADKAGCLLVAPASASGLMLLPPVTAAAGAPEPLWLASDAVSRVAWERSI